MQRAGEGLPSDRRSSVCKFLAALRFIASRTWVLALLLLLPVPGLAAGFTCSQPVTSNVPSSAKDKLDELQEVVVNGEKSTDGTRDLSKWLSLLEGQFSYEGYVDLCGQGNAADQRPVNGKARCSILHGHAEPIRNLSCIVDVRWPEVRGENGVPVIGGESSLSPAVVVYGLEHDLPGLQFTQIDNKGIATHAKGRLVGDTLTTREPCGMPGGCQKITRITARPDSSDIAMLIDFEIGSRRVLRQAFLLHRVANIGDHKSGLLWAE